MSDSSDNETQTKGKSKSNAKWGEKLRFISPISKPLAGRKETKHILKLVKKGTIQLVERTGRTEFVPNSSGLRSATSL
jgi:hypothetical protein